METVETKCPKCGAINQTKMGNPFVDVWRGIYNILRCPMVRCFVCDTMYWWSQDSLSGKWGATTNLLKKVKTN